MDWVNLDFHVSCDITWFHQGSIVGTVCTMLQWGYVSMEHSM